MAVELDSGPFAAFDPEGVDAAAGSSDSGADGADSGADGADSDGTQYDTDLDDPEEVISPLRVEIGCKTYRSACERLSVPAVSRVVEGLGTSVLSLRYRSIGPQGAEALCRALRRNTTLERLDLEETGLGPAGGAHVMDMLKENNYLVDVNLSKNFIGSCDTVTNWENLADNCTVTTLNLSSNNLTDNDAERLAFGIMHNVRLVSLDLSRNSFTEVAAKQLAQAIRCNDTIQRLDISWSQFRSQGAVTLCSGIQHNSRISELNLSWVGLGYGGTLAVATMLRTNGHLVELDISNNRIFWDAAALVADALKRNDTLQVLKMGHNPLTLTGCLKLLMTARRPNSALVRLALDGVPVNRKAVYIAETITKSRPFEFVHGTVVESEDTFGKLNVARWDPLKLLVQFLSDRGIRPVELFRTFDKDNESRVSRRNFIEGLKKAKVPLSRFELDRVSDRLCCAKSGKISYQLLVEGFREQALLNREEEKKKRDDEKRNAAEHERILRPRLPTITETTTATAPSVCSGQSSSRRSAGQALRRPDGTGRSALSLHSVAAAFKSLISADRVTLDSGLSPVPSVTSSSWSEARMTSREMTLPSMTPRAAAGRPAVDRSTTLISMSSRLAPDEKPLNLDYDRLIANKAKKSKRNRKRARRNQL